MARARVSSRDPSFCRLDLAPTIEPPPPTIDHGDIKDACNGTNGGACAHSLALEAVQPRLHHARRAARHLAQRQHGMRCSWRSRHGSCRCMDFKPIELLIAAWLLKLGPRLTKSNIEYVILQWSQFRRTKCEYLLQPLAGPRAAVGRSAAVLCVRRLLPLRHCCSASNTAPTRSLALLV